MNASQKQFHEQLRKRKEQLKKYLLRNRSAYPTTIAEARDILADYGVGLLEGYDILRDIYGASTTTQELCQ